MGENDHIPQNVYDNGANNNLGGLSHGDFQGGPRVADAQDLDMAGIFNRSFDAEGNDGAIPLNNNSPYIKVNSQLNIQYNPRHIPIQPRNGRRVYVAKKNNTNNKFF